MKAEGVARRERREEAEHFTFAEWVQWHEAEYPMLKLMFHPPNGERRHIGVAMKLKRMLVRPGVPDFVFPWPSPCGKFQGLFIELKAKEKARLSVNQYNYIQLIPHSFKKVIAMGADEAIAAVKEYLGI